MALAMGERTAHEPEPEPEPGSHRPGRGSTPPDGLQYSDRRSARNRVLIEALRTAHIYGDGTGVTISHSIEERAGSDQRSGEGVVFRGRRVPLQGDREWRRNDVVAIKVIADDLFGIPVTQEGLLAHFARMVDQFHLVRALRAPGLVIPHSVFLVDARLPKHEWLYSVLDGDLALFTRSPVRPVAVVEWVEGVALSRWNARKGVTDRLGVLRPVAQAIDAMHLSGASFRDLKPENLVVRGEDAVLVDLGMIEPAELRMMDPREGGPYVDPDGKSYGYTRDLYAFAALLVHQLTFPDVPSSHDHIALQAHTQARHRLSAAGVCREIADILATELHVDHRGREGRGKHSGALEGLLDEVLAATEGPAVPRRRGGRR